eukprot:13976400-Alexandrium_andersonii.AAC.1
MCRPVTGAAQPIKAWRTAHEQSMAQQACHEHPLPSDMSARGYQWIRAVRCWPVLTCAAFATIYALACIRM